MSRQPAKRGRPPKGDDSMANPVSVRFKLEQLDLIDEMIEQHPIIEDRNTMIRQLVDIGAEGMQKQIKLLKGSK